jgi:triphosphoribosyl-dephospho-CoA synthase
VADIGMWVQTACTWEVTARKVGDVNPVHDLDTLKFADFTAAAAAFAPVFDEAPQRRVGETVLDAVRVMRRQVNKNTHLGTILLLAPLAAVPIGDDLETGLERVLSSLDVTDARLVYQAIRLAEPSGLGHVPEQDVVKEPTLPLRQIMALAASRDMIARQYADGWSSRGFRDVLDLGVSALRCGIGQTGSVEGAILLCQLLWLVEPLDSLIVRKRGVSEAEEARRRARAVIERGHPQGWPHSPAAMDAWLELDRWLRAEPGRNPGTTADLVAASLFVALRSGILTVPPTLPWVCDLVP